MYLDGKLSVPQQTAFISIFHLLYIAIGLVGFARMMPGDIYEVILRHGHQKWKSKGKIGINTQTWDHNSFVFKVLLGDVLNVKVSAGVGISQYIEKEVKS